MQTTETSPRPLVGVKPPPRQTKGLPPAKREGRGLVGGADLFFAADGVADTVR